MIKKHKRRQAVRTRSKPVRSYYYEFPTDSSHWFESTSCDVDGAIAAAVNHVLKNGYRLVEIYSDVRKPFSVTHKVTKTKTGIWIREL